MAERRGNLVTAPMALSETSDEALMERIQRGERSAFADLVQRHTNRFYRLAYRMTAAKDDAEDIVQQAFLKLWEDPQKWKRAKKSKFTTWFYRVVVNLCLDANKKKRPQHLERNGQLSDGKQHASAETQLMQKRQQQWLEQSLAELPARQQVALNLCFYEGLSNREAAEVMGLRIKALESLLMRAKQQLKTKAQTIMDEA